jgi:hypothetical protein
MANGQPPTSSTPTHSPRIPEEGNDTGGAKQQAPNSQPRMTAAGYYAPSPGATARPGDGEWCGSDWKSCTCTCIPLFVRFSDGVRVPRRSLLVLLPLSQIMNVVDSKVGPGPADPNVFADLSLE